MSSKQILIIDDDKDLTDILSDELMKDGLTVHVAHDGSSGLKMALDKKPDLILLDIKMPGMDGIAMLEQLRLDPWGKGVEVIFLTVLDQPEVLSRALELGGYEYFVKTDWKIKDIVARIREKLGVK